VTTAVPSTSSAERAYRRRVFAWTWYDWADHAYITSTASTFFPPYFIAIAAPALMGAGATGDAAAALARDTASNLYALTVSIALFIAALLAPVIGAYADITGRRKRLLIAATAVGACIASAMFVLVTGMWLAALLMYAATQVAMNIALGLNSSLLPHIARPDDLNRVSSLGYAMGYVGGGVLLALNTVLFLAAPSVGLDSSLAVRIAFLSVGVWWLGFSLPLMLRIGEPPAAPLTHGSRGNPVADAFTRLGHTLADIRRYRELFKMLIAFWLYSEGIGAIILLATAYGAALGLNTAILIGTLLMTQFVAFPYALIYGRIPDGANKWRGAYVFMLLWTAVTLPLFGLYANRAGNVSVPVTFGFLVADQVLGIGLAVLVGRRLLARFAGRLDAKRTVILGLAIYTIIPVWGFFLRSQAEFFLIGWLVGTVQGGTQALSRAIYADLSPRRKSGEFFGLYGLSEKFAGILGPLLYAAVGQLTHDPRASVLSISVFFAAGIYMLWRVDERAGKRVADEENAEIEVPAHL
jgi:UMF1 family MFS transporter